MYVLVMGTAGSGKTTLVKSYGDWLVEQGASVRRVNLDPGAEVVPYKPDFDVRELFTIEDIMRKYNVGPNGAQLIAAKLIVERMGEIISHPAFKADEAQVLIDTPGQLEVFMFRREGSVFTKALKKRAPTVGVYLVDGELAEDLQDLVAAWLLGLLLQVKLEIPVIPVISKADMIRNREYAVKLIEDPESLIEEINARLRGLGGSLAADLAKLAADYRQSLRPVLVSAKTGEGFEDLFSVVHEAFCSCGDLT